jgi:excisionase family DNA binding protein
MSAETPDGPAALFSPAEFARYSGLSIATVRRYLASGKLPKIQPKGARGRVLIPREALTASCQSAGGNAECAGTVIPESAVESSPASKRGPAPRWRRRY